MDECYCEDFEEEDGDLCVCGHLLDEHEPGFFRRCSHNTEDVEDGPSNYTPGPLKKIATELPEATKKPCNDCPWRRVAAPGWLGPFTAEEWVALAHGEEAIACHQTIEDEGQWTGNIRQCAGAAIYRANVCKSPRDPQVARLEADREAVFARSTEFVDYHQRGPA